MPICSAVKARRHPEVSASSISRTRPATNAHLRIIRALSEVIRAWAQQQGVDTVLWTAIGPRFAERTGTAFSVDAAMHYLAALPDPTRNMALDYIRNAPAEVVTPVRTRVQADFPHQVPFTRESDPGRQ